MRYPAYRFLVLPVCQPETVVQKWDMLHREVWQCYAQCAAQITHSSAAITSDSLSLMVDEVHRLVVDEDSSGFLTPLMCGTLCQQTTGGKNV